VAAHGRVAGPALGAGALCALSLPPWGWWPLAFVGTGWLWWRLEGLRLRDRLVAGWCFGLGTFVIGLWWVTSFSLAGGLLLMALEALAPALASAVAPRGRGRIPALAGAMVLGEALRSRWPLGGLPLGGLALGQVGGPLAGAARLGGPLLLVGLLWLGGGAFGLLAVTAVRVARRRRAAGREPAGWRQLLGGPPPADVRTLATVPVAGAGRAAALALVVVGAAALGGAYAPDGGPALQRLAVAAVQGGGVRGLRQSQVAPATVFAAQVAATGLLPVGRRAASLVLWPEDVVALDQPLAGSPAAAVLSGLARSERTTLVAGVTEPAGPGHFRNEIVAYGPDGALDDVFEKVHRVPFGEYVPWRGLVRHLADLSAVPEDAVPGRGDGVLHTPVGPLGTMVSYEVFFPGRARVATRAGAELLLVPTNTSSYSTSQVPSQEVAAARLQALAQGRDLVQAAPTGFSALVDHDGRLLERSALGQRDVVSGTLALRRGRTVYERLGDLAVVLGAVALLGVGWLGDLTRGT